MGRSREEGRKQKKTRWDKRDRRYRKGEQTQAYTATTEDAAKAGRRPRPKRTRHEAARGKETTEAEAKGTKETPEPGRNRKEEEKTREKKVKQLTE